MTIYRVSTILTMYRDTGVMEVDMYRDTGVMEVDMYRHTGVEVDMYRGKVTRHISQKSTYTSAKYI